MPGEQAAGAINPRQPSANRTAPTNVEFDVAVTVTEASDTGGEAKLSVAWLNVGGGMSSSYQNQAISRIRFVVPVALPSLEMAEHKPRPVVQAPTDFDPLSS